MPTSPIIPADTAIETFRDNGYKNTASAISELIDNSIDAKAKNIQILILRLNQVSDIWIFLIDFGVPMGHQKIRYLH